MDDESLQIFTLVLQGLGLELMTYYFNRLAFNSKVLYCVYTVKIFFLWQPQQMVVIEPSQFITDYRGFAIVMTVIFAVLGPLSLLTGIPAVVAAFRVS
jgi:hypothetical protein